MRNLNYETLKEIGYKGYYLETAPEKVLQFGEGAFLRAFVDYWFDLANENAGWNGKCVLVKPTASRSGTVQAINDQEGLYTLHLRGCEKGKKVDNARIISSVSRCLNPYEREDYDAMMTVAESDDLEIIVSNTTEAGIVYDPACQFSDCPPSSFPAKLTQVLYRRYQAEKPGVLVLACELIDDNGRELLNCVNRYIDQWGLESPAVCMDQQPDLSTACANEPSDLPSGVEESVQGNGRLKGFRSFVNEECTFCGSLVDRIVPGRIRDPGEVAALEAVHGYTDALLDVGEVFGLWVIEGEEALNDVLPFARAGLRENVFVTPDMRPYKKRKVRILNGAHTGFALGAYLAGENIVRDCMQDAVIKGFMNRMLSDEVIPTLIPQQPTLRAGQPEDCAAASIPQSACPEEQGQSRVPVSMSQKDLTSFTEAVEDRFNNPFVDHELLSISLNSTAKWKARNLPSLLEYIGMKGELPICLTTSLAAYIAFYSSDIQELNEKGLICRRPVLAGLESGIRDCRENSKLPEAQTYTVSDDRQVLEFYYAHRADREEELVHAVLTEKQMWGQDLSEINGLEAKTAEILKKIRVKGARAAFADCLEYGTEQL